jgi:hypothetical protein
MQQNQQSERKAIMKNAKKTVVLTSLFALMVTMAQADDFYRPPDENNNAPVWSTPFPYQRNIDMNFNVNPVASPGSGIPGAVYEGTLDSSLLSSDFVTLSGSVQWFTAANSPNGVAGIGIYNTTGGPLSGSAVFHIDNLDDNLPVKNVWLEALDYDHQAFAGQYLTWDVKDPNGNAATQLAGVPLGPPPNVQDPFNVGDLDLVLSDAEFQLTPNPTYETIEINFNAVPAGDYTLVEDFHIATECVPEPATFSLLALGGLALLWRRRS